MRGLGVALVVCLLAAALFAATRTEIIVPVGTGEVRVRPTFCSCGLCFGVTTNVNGLVIKYRKVGDADWLTESRFPYFDDVNNHRGSIFGLAEDTEYEFKIVAGDTQYLAPQTFRTWASEVPIAETVYLDANTTFPVSVGCKGTASGWIRYTTAKGFVLDNQTADKYCFNVKDAEYVVFDDMIIRGSPARYVFYIEKSSNVRIRNCDIARWGRSGVPRYDFNTDKDGKYYPTKLSTSSINFDPAININAGCNSIVVERCFVHDPIFRSCSWYYSHPAGPEAVMMYKPDHSTVLRYNDFVGSDSHRWNDGVEGSGNFHTDGGFNREADIYGNYISYCDDDCIELDGGMQNVRCFNNRFENALCGVSIQGCMVSPTYVLSNLFSGMCDEQALAGQTIKTDHKDTQPNGISNSVAYVADNIMMKRGSGISMRPSLTIIAENNAMYDGNKVSNFGNDVTKCHPGSVNDNNESRGASTDSTADGNYPYRPLPFSLGRSLVNGITIKDGKVRYPQPGALDIGGVVFRYEGADAINRRAVTCSAPVVGSTNSPAVYDLRSNLTFANNFTTGPLPFVKTGPGDMIFDGGSGATYTFVSGQPGTGIKIPDKIYRQRFSLPADGTLPTGGYNTISLLEGRMIFNSGTPTVSTTGGFFTLGGWTAGQNEQEKDVSLVISNSYFTASSSTILGNFHGFANYNTPDRPVVSELIINNGGTFRIANGRIMYVGAYNAADTALSGKNYNSIVRLVVNKGGIFTHADSYSGTYFRQRKGQAAQLVVDGGTYTERNVWIGDNAAAKDTTATVSIEILNGGIMEGEYFTNNVSLKASPPAVNVSVRDGGKLLYDSIGNKGYSPNFTISVDGGTIGTRNISNKIPSPEKGLISTNIIVKVGAKGMTVETSGLVKGVPLIANVSSPIVSGVANGKDGGINFVTGEGNTIRVNEDITCSGPVTASGDGTVEFLNGAKIVYDIPEGVTSTVTIAISGDYPVVKRGLGHLVISSIDSGFTGKVTVEKGTIGFPDGATISHSLVFNGGGVMIPTGETITLAGAVSGSSLAVEGEGDLVLQNQANSIRRIVLDTANVICGAAYVCTNAVLEYRGSVLEDGIGYFDIKGRDQRVFDIFTPEIPKDTGGCQITNSSTTLATLYYNPTTPTNCYVKLDGNLDFNFSREPLSGGCEIRLRNRRHTMSGKLIFKRNELMLDEGTAFPRLTKIYNSNGTKMHVYSTESDLFEDLYNVEFGSVYFYLCNAEAVDAMTRCRPELKTTHAENSKLYIGAGRELPVKYWKATQSSGSYYMPMGVYNLNGSGGAVADAKIQTGDLLVWSDRESGYRPTHSNLVWNSTASASITNAANWSYVGEFPTFRVPMAQAEFGAVGTEALVDSRAVWGGVKFTASAADFTLADGGGSLALVDSGIVVSAGSDPRTFTIEAPIDNCGEELKVVIPQGDRVILSDALTNLSQIALSGAGTLSVKTDPQVAKLSVATLISVSGGIAYVDARTSSSLALTSDDRLTIPAGVEILVCALTLDGTPIGDGSYSRTSPQFADIISGDGKLTVMRTGTYLYFQ